MHAFKYQFIQTHLTWKFAWLYREGGRQNKNLPSTEIQMIEKKTKADFSYQTHQISENK